MSFLRETFRLFRLTPAMTIAAILTIALGAGVALAIFSIVYGAVFKGLPFDEPGRLVTVTPGNPETGSRGFSLAKPLFVHGRNLPGVIDIASIGRTRDFRVGPDPSTESALRLTQATHNVLDVLGTPPVLGRGFVPADIIGDVLPALISYDAWRGRFAGSEAVLGQRLTRGTTRAVIVGVLPPPFILPAASRPSLWDGFVLMPTDLQQAAVREVVAPAIARLAPDASVQLLQAQFDDLSSRLEPELLRPGARRGPRVIVESLRVGMYWQTWPYLMLLLATASLVWLATGANLACILLVRSQVQEEARTLRACLGASRATLIGRELFYGFAVALFGGVLAYCVNRISADLLLELVPSHFRPLVLHSDDWRLVGVAVAFILLTSLTASLIPAWRSSGRSTVEVLRRSDRHSIHVHPSTKVLLSLEAAISVVLAAALITSGRSLVGLASADLGFEPKALHVVEARARPPSRTFDSSIEAELRRVLMTDVNALAVGAVDNMPSSGDLPSSYLRWNGTLEAGLWQATDGFLTTIQARFRAGRDLVPDDVRQGREVAVISSTAAAMLWPDLDLTSVPGHTLTAATGVRTVVGVVDDVLDGPRDNAQSQVFVPMNPSNVSELHFTVRSRPGRSLDIDRIRREFARLGTDVVQAGAAGTLASSALEQPKVLALVLSLLAFVGVTVGSTGVFFTCMQESLLRRKEVAVRGALGSPLMAVRLQLARAVMGSVVIGVGLGILAAWWTAVFLDSLVYEVDIRAPVSLLGAAVPTLFAAAVSALISMRGAVTVARTPSRYLQ